MNASELIGREVTIVRAAPQDGGTQTIVGVCEWVSADLRNYRIEGFGHCGIPRGGGTIRYQGRDYATVTLSL